MNGTVLKYVLFIIFVFYYSILLISFWCELSNSVVISFHIL